MATHDFPILGFATAPDNSGEVFFEPLESAMTLGTATLGNTLCCTFTNPTQDNYLYGAFTIPQNYVGTPVMVILGVARAATGIYAFHWQHISKANDEAIDVAYSAEESGTLNLATAPHADEDMCIITATLTAGDYAVGDQVFFRIVRDVTTDTVAADFNLTGLFFRYNDA